MFVFLGGNVGAAAAQAGPTRPDWIRIKGTLERILVENIVPFWYPAALDREHGGYRLNHDKDGAWLGPANKRLVTQARTVWFFSRLYNSPYGKKDHLDAARHGYEFLRDRMLDRVYGGYYSEVDSAGTSTTMSDKHLYAQSFVLYALSEYAKASGDRAALALARDLFGTLEYRAHDAQYGGYREFFLRDWSRPPADSVSFMGMGPGVKLYNTHLHLMEAITAYYRVTRDPVARERLLELIVINSNAVVRKGLGACTDRHRRNWEPFRGPEYDVASYGHDIENVWLLMEACDAAGISNGPLTDLYRALYEYALQYGYDKKEGGFYYTGPFKKPADNRDKSWWMQSEALVSALRMYALTGEMEYFDCFARTLDWVVKRQVDWKHGDWHHLVKEDGTIVGSKSGAWKSPYHNGRAVLECLQTIESLSRKQPL